MRSIGTRIFAGVSAAVVLGLGVAACGDGENDAVDKDKLVSKIQDESEGTIKDDQANCLADVYIKYAKGNILNDLLDGKKKFGDIDDASDFMKDADKEDEADKAYQDCLK